MARTSRRRCRKSSARASRRIFLLATAALPTCSALAGDRTWNTNFTTGNWNNAISWTGSLFPVAGDNAYLLANSVTDYLVTFNLATNPAFNNLRIGNTAPGTNVFALQSNSALTMSFANESVGYDGRGVYSQSSGTNSIASTLTLGELATGIGTYNLSGGFLVNTVVNVGLNGTGTFNQSGGTHTLGSLQLGLNLNSVGNYSMSNGANLSAGAEAIGIRGTGTFNQTGGNNTCAGDIKIGFDSGTGSYNLSGGNLSCATLFLGGAPGQGFFTQTGGNFTAASVGESLAGNGVFYLQGGTATISGHFQIINGLFFSSGLLDVGSISKTAGGPGFQWSGNSTLQIHGSDLQIIPNVNVPFEDHLILNSGQTLKIINSHNLQIGNLTQNGYLVVKGGVADINSLQINSGAVTVTMGGQLTTHAADQLGAAASSMIVSGAGSLYSAVNASLGFDPGLNSNSPASTLEIDAGATASFGGSLTLWPNGIVNLAGGALNVNAISSNGGNINFTGGAINVAGSSLTIDAIGPLGPVVDLTPNKSLSVPNLTIESGALVTLDGGMLITASLVNHGGALVFNSGTLKFLQDFRLGAGSVNPVPAPLGASYTLGAEKSIIAGNSFTIDAGASLYLPGGSVSSLGITKPPLPGAGAGSYPFSNSGEIQLDGIFAAVNASEIGNYALIAGNGRLNATNVYNLGELRAVAGQRLLVTGTLFNGSSSLNNTLSPTAAINALGGTIETGGGVSNVASISMTGGVLKVGAAFTNGPTGIVAGRGTIIAASLNNAGQMSFSSGNTDVFAPVVNTATGKIIVSGGGTATFYNSVSGIAGTEIRVSTNSAAVFFGAVSGPISFTGTGAKYFEGGISQAGPIAAGGVTFVDAPASLTVDYIREKSLTVTGQMAIRPNGPASKVNTLSVDSAAGGKLDLAYNALIVDYATAADSPITSIRAMLIAGYANGTWTGNGISSSTAAADSHKALGYAEASQALGAAGGTFSGLPADGTSVLIRYTLKGDTNLDGVVGFADLVAVAQHYGEVGGGTWFTGDTNYDGNVGFADLVAVAQNYGHDLSGAAIPGATPEFTRDLPLAFASVPEPVASGALVAFVIGGMAARPRRYRRRTQGQGSGGDRV